MSEYRPKHGPVLTFPHLQDISKPGFIIVDGDGRRFANESAPYQDLGRATVAAGVREEYLIADKRHLQRYGMGLALPHPYPIAHLIRRGYIVTAPTIQAMAQKLKMSSETLSNTVDNFNQFARNGKDLDFGRGDAPHDRSSRRS